MDSAIKDILLLTDDLIFIDKVRNILDSRYYKLTVSSSLPDDFFSVEKNSYSLFIVDILSKSFNPIQTIEKIKNHKPAGETRILVASQNRKIENIVGPTPRVSGYLSKPVDFDELKKSVSSYVLENKKILIVDDDREFSELIKMFLDAQGYEAYVENNPLKAKEAVKNIQPALLFLDIMMPGKDGFEVMQELQEERKTASVPIIIITALKFDSYQDKGMLTGFPEMIYKELDEKFLLEQIEKKINDSEDGGLSSYKVKPRVLLADDQTELLMLVKETVENAGFEVFIASDGEEAVRTVYETNPDIIIMDYNMPVKDGLTAAAELKDNPLFAHIPIVIVTAFGEKQAKLRGLSMGIDDYLIKPVDTDELVARIKMVLKRNKQVLDTNPLSKLPGNPSIQARIERALSEKKKFAVLYIDLNNFKAYNDVYGFEAGDRVIKATANLLVKIAMPNENSGDFIGHIGGDDFIMITSFERAEEISAKITKSFDEISPSFYKKEDAQKGYITAYDRQNNLRKFPLLAISVAIVHNNLRELTSYAQISNIGSELKKAAKAFEKSAYVMDKRKN